MSRFIKTSLVALIFVLLSESGVAKESQGKTSQVEVCESITNSKPGSGVEYKGSLRNSDYGLNVKIPPGLTGWGAAPEAPFHGFAIFLADQPKSCIIFEVHLRISIDESNSIDGGPAVKRVRIGNRIGWEAQTKGMIDGVEWTNIIVRFSIRHVRSAHDIDDGSITLVTRTQDLDKRMPIFQNFVSNIRFEGKELISSRTDAHGGWPRLNGRERLTDGGERSL
jgi:hypothetical protein